MEGMIDTDIYSLCSVISVPQNSQTKYMCASAYTGDKNRVCRFIGKIVYMYLNIVFSVTQLLPIKCLRIHGYGTDVCFSMATGLMYVFVVYYRL
jgi:hypothetical protein